MPAISHLSRPRPEEAHAWTAAVHVAVKHFEVADDVRRAAVYLAACGCNLSRRGVARVSGLNRTRILDHLRNVEDRRELQAELDALFNELTDEVQRLWPVGAGG